LTDGALHVSRRRDRWIISLMGALFTVIGLGFALGIIAQWTRESALRASGSARSATVTGKDIEIDDGAQHFVRYVLTMPTGARFEKRRQVPERVWSSVTIGDSVRALYDPGDPGNNMLAGESQSSVGFAAGMALFSIVFAAFGAFLTYAGLRGPDQAVTAAQRSRKNVSRP
jgi:Protein of unknown function (DUF3592)